MRLILAGLLTLVLTATAFAAPKLANKTYYFYGPGHGSQVEYYDAKGRSWLWYPGNDIVLPGHWKADGDSLCFKYTPNSYNPVTGANGATWECTSMASFDKQVRDVAAGDVFGLAKRAKVPFSLPRGKTSIPALLGRMK